MIQRFIHSVQFVETLKTQIVMKQLIQISFLKTQIVK